MPRADEIILSAIKKRWLLTSPLQLIGLAVGSLAALRLVQSAAALIEVQQIDYYEGVVYDNAARLLRHEALYHPIDQPPYEVAAYMPAYPLLAAGIRALVGNGFGPGRALSVVAGLLTAYFVARITTSRCGRPGAGAFASGVFLALSFPGIYPWMAVYRVDMLGVGFAVASIAVLQLGHAGRVNIIAAASLASLAILTKQVMFSAALAGSVWLWHRDRRQSALFSALVLVIVGITCAGFELSTHAFIANTIASNINPTRGDVLLTNVGIYLAFEAGPLVAALIYVLRYQAGRRHTDLLFLYWIASWVPLIGMAKVGAYYNYWIENAAATAIFATLGVWSSLHASHTARNAGFGAPLLAIALGLIVAAPLVAGGEFLALFKVLTVSERNTAFESVIALVKAEPGQVISEPYDAAVLAERPVEMETVIYSILFEEGRWDPRPMIERICSGQIRLLVLDRPIAEAQDFSFFDVYWWPRPIIATLRQSLQLGQVEAGRYFYTPRPELSTVNCQ